MRFGIWALRQQPVDEVIELARHAERTGWDGCWVADHFMPHAEDLNRPRFEAMAMVAALSIAVPRIRLGTLVCGNTYRHPVLLTKAAVTADHLSGGRVVLGLGAAWQENEHLAYGIPFPGVKERLDRLAEACVLIKMLLGQSRSDFEGEHYQLRNAPLAPKPVGPFPLLVGGAGEKRTLRIVAEYADAWSCWGTPEHFAAKSLVLDAHCEAIGRDPATVARIAHAQLMICETADEARRARQDVARPERTIVGTLDDVVDVVHHYAELGVEEFVVPDQAFGPPGRRETLMDAFIHAVRTRH